MIRQSWLLVKNIDALYYNEMFYSCACWNTDAAVDREMNNMNSKSYKLPDLKESISMMMVGLVWEYLSPHCSKNGKAFTP